MTTYNVQDESKRILYEHLLQDSKLNFPEAFVEAAAKVSIISDDSKPFLPCPLKITESSSALCALIATGASAIARQRFGVEHQDITINSDIATLFLLSILLPTVDGKPVMSNAHILQGLKKADLYDIGKPIHRQSSNIYKTKDGRWYHLHGSLNAAQTMKMMGVQEQDVSSQEAIGIYADKVAQWDSEEIERVANDQYRQAGVGCYTPEEFFGSEQGKAMGDESLYTLKSLFAPRKAWQPASNEDLQPLAGVKVLDFTRALAGPVISKILAVLGAQVLRITSDTLPDIYQTGVDLGVGKHDANVNLKTAHGRKQFEELVETADVVIDGYRPGVLAKFGFTAEAMRKNNPSLVYLRENCYGFKGPLSHRSGWQQISDCLVGQCWLQGRFLGLDEPVLPLLPNSDYQMGLAGAAAVVQALYCRAQEDVTFDIDTSLTQYNIWFLRLGEYSPSQKKDLLARNAGFTARHYDDILDIVTKTTQAMRAVRPDMFTNNAYFEEMSGVGWGIQEPIRVLVPPFALSKSKLGNGVPSGLRGRSQPRWS